MSDGNGNTSDGPIDAVPSRAEVDRHADRARRAVRDGGRGHPGHPVPDLEDGAGQPPRRVRTVGPPRRQGLPRLRGRAHDLRPELPDRRRPRPPAGRPIRRAAGRPGVHRHAQPPRLGHGLLGHHHHRCRRRAPQRLVDGRGARLRPGRFGHQGRVRGRGAPAAHRPPPGRHPRSRGHDRVVRGARSRHRRPAVGRGLASLERPEGGALPVIPLRRRWSGPRRGHHPSRGLHRSR